MLEINGATLTHHADLEQKQDLPLGDMALQGQECSTTCRPEKAPPRPPGAQRPRKGGKSSGRTSPNLLLEETITRMDQWHLPLSLMMLHLHALHGMWRNGHGGTACVERMEKRGVSKVVVSAFRLHPPYL